MRKFQGGKEEQSFGGGKREIKGSYHSGRRYLRASHKGEKREIEVSREKNEERDLLIVRKKGRAWGTNLYGVALWGRG